MYTIVKKSFFEELNKKVETYQEYEEIYQEKEERYEEWIKDLNREKESNQDKISRLQRDNSYLKDLLRQNNINFRGESGVTWRLIKFRLKYCQDEYEAGLIDYYPGRKPKANRGSPYFYNIDVKSAVTLKEWSLVSYVDLLQIFSKNHQTYIIEDISESEFNYLKSTLLEDPDDKVIFLWKDRYAEDHDVYTTYAIEVEKENKDE